MNITDIAPRRPRPFDEVCRKADARGVRVTGTEIVGLVPQTCAHRGREIFPAQTTPFDGIAEQEIVCIAVRSMGLMTSNLSTPAEKVIEYLLEAEDKQNGLLT